MSLKTKVLKVKILNCLVQAHTHILIYFYTHMLIYSCTQKGPKWGDVISEQPLSNIS